MKRPAIFITYFQSPFQIVHIYEVLHFEYFFQKFYGRFNLMAIFFSLCTTFSRKLVKRLNNFMTDFQSSYRYVHARKSLSSDIFLKKYGSPLKMLTIYY